MVEGELVEIQIVVIGLHCRYTFADGIPSSLTGSGWAYLIIVYRKANHIVAFLCINMGGVLLGAWFTAITKIPVPGVYRIVLITWSRQIGKVNGPGCCLLSGEISARLIPACIKASACSRRVVVIVGGITSVAIPGNSHASLHKYIITA
jgi:hypothetical protein